MSARTISDAKPGSFNAILASFSIGVGSMVVAGLIWSVAAGGGLSLTNAHAATLEHRAPVIAPLDVAAVNAQLAQADATMKASQNATDVAMARLQRLSTY